ncbi:MAG: site-specific DNA-methyltransferase, partial [Elusimicrobiota bacterium]
MYKRKNKKKYLVKDNNIANNFLNHIFLGDCVETMKKISTEVVDLIITSPPYYNAIDYTSHTKSPVENYRSRPKIDYYEYLIFLERSFLECFRILKKGKYCAVIIGTILESGKHIPLPFDFLEIMKKIGYEFHQDIIWHKCTAGIRRAGSVIQKPYPGYYYPNIMTEYILIFKKNGGEEIYRNKTGDEKNKSKIEIDSVFTRDIANNLWNIAPVPPRIINHPCPFPEEIPFRLIKLYSYRGDLIFDPFAGAGTTLKVAKHLGRNYIGCEIEKKYVGFAKSFVNTKLNIREKQLIMDFKKIGHGEIIPGKNKNQKRYRKL